MARFNEILHGRFNRLLQKTFGHKGPPPSPQLSTEVMPTFPLFRGHELMILEGWHLFGCAMAAVAVAAQFSSAAIRNPPNSGAIAVLENAIILPATNVVGLGYPHIYDGGVDFGNLSTVAPMDGRQSGFPVSGGSALVASFGANATLPGPGASQFWWTNSVVAPLYPWNGFEVVLPPGARLSMYDATVNEACKFAFIWRERPLEDAEKSA